MNSTFIIRDATVDDIPAILQLLYLKADFDGCPDSVFATPETLQRDLFNDNPLAFVLLAEVNQEIIGFATYYRIYSSFLAKPALWLDDLFIKSAFRYQGIGTALIQTLCTIAQTTNCGRIDWTVAINNPNGIQFYQRMGATINESVRLCRLDRDAIEHNALPANAPKHPIAT